MFLLRSPYPELPVPRHPISGGAFADVANGVYQAARGGDNGQALVTAGWLPAFLAACLAGCLAPWATASASRNGTKTETNGWLDITAKDVLHLAVAYAQHKSISCLRLTLARVCLNTARLQLMYEKFRTEVTDASC